MSVAKVIELSAESSESFDHAIEEGLDRARKTLDHLKSVWVKDQEIVLDESGGVSHYRVHLKVTFLLE
mgnify:CR=1 FL=1|jgi:hypothetical protein